jgi:hypothetical protein
MPTHAEQTSLFSAEVEPAQPKTKAARPGRLVQLRTGPIDTSDPQQGFEFDPDLGRWVDVVAWARPSTWGDCKAIGEGDPCPFVLCRHHLWSASPVRGPDGDPSEPGELPGRVRWFEHLVDTLEPEEWGETCSLRVASRVRLEASPEGKWVGRSSIEGETIGRPGPVLGGGAHPRWVQQEAELSAPTEVNDAVIGRLMGGASRESVRQWKLGALDKVMGDQGLADLADDFDIDTG